MRFVKYHIAVCPTGYLGPSTNLEIGITEYVKNNPYDYDILQLYCQEIKFFNVYDPGKWYIALNACIILARSFTEENVGYGTHLSLMKPYRQFC